MDLALTLAVVALAVACLGRRVLRLFAARGPATGCGCAGSKKACGPAALRREPPLA